MANDTPTDRRPRKEGGREDMQPAYSHFRPLFVLDLRGVIE